MSLGPRYDRLLSIFQAAEGGAKIFLGHVVQTYSPRARGIIPVHTSGKPLDRFTLAFMQALFLPCKGSAWDGRRKRRQA